MLDFLTFGAARSHDVLVVAECEQDQLRVRTGDPRDALAIKSALLVQQDVKASQIKQEIEGPVDPGTVQMRDVAPHEFDIDAGVRGSASRHAKRAFDRVDARRLPPQFREIDGGLPHAATDIEGAAGRRRLRPLQQFAQALQGFALPAIPRRVS